MTTVKEGGFLHLNKELTINTQIIEENSLSKLNEVLGQLDLPMDKTPFANKSA